MKRSVFKAYTDDYKRIIFQVWYSNGRPNIPDLLSLIPEDVNGRKPSRVMIRKWKDEEGWEMQADEMDAKAIVVSDDFLVRQKSEMLMRQANIGFVLQEIGLRALVSGGFDSSSSAVQAIRVGSELERTSMGIGEMLVKMAKMSDADLEQEIIKQIQRASDAGQVVDAEEVEESTDTDE